MTNDLNELVKRGEALAAEGRIEEAEAVCDGILELDPDHPGALHFRGVRLMNKQKFDESEAALRHALRGDPANLQTQFALAMALYIQNKLDEALEILDASGAQEPNQPHVWLYRGVLLESQQKQTEAVRSFMKGLSTMDRMGMAPVEEETKELVRHANMAAALELDRRFDAALAPMVEQHGEEAVARIRKAGDMFIGKIPAEAGHPLQKPGLFHVPDLSPRIFFDPAEFPWTKTLQSEFETIRSEMQSVMAGDEDLYFIRHGERQEENCQRCPRTMALIDALELHHVPGYSPQVLLSVLPAGGSIPARYGPVNGRVIAHLPLKVPEPPIKLRVGEEEREWKAGEMLLFDDSFQHEANNPGSEPQVVLIFDVWNPELSAVEREAFSAVLQTAQQFEKGLI